MAKQGFGTRKDGTVYPLTPKKKGGTAAAAVVVAGVMAVGAGGFGGAGAGTAADSVLTQALRAKTNASKSHASKGRSTQAWNRFGYRQLRDRAEPALDCAVNSYGQVHQLFLEEPCRWLDRRLFTVDDGSGNTVAVSIAWVRMSSSGDARELRALTDTDGTGSVTALGAVGPQLGNSRFTGEAYTSDRKGRLVVISEATALRGEPDVATMDAATQVAVVFPPPRR